MLQKKDKKIWSDEIRPANPSDLILLRSIQQNAPAPTGMLRDDAFYWISLTICNHSLIANPVHRCDSKIIAI